MNSIPVLSAALWNHGLLALQRSHTRQPLVLTAQQSAAVASLVTVFLPALYQPAVGEAQRMSYKLLIAVPWACPPADASANTGHTYGALGVMFDSLNIRPQRLRALALHWLEWSEGNLRSLADVWKAALITAGYSVNIASPQRAQRSANDVVPN
jgi:hypothetical protein